MSIFMVNFYSNGYVHLPEMFILNHLIFLFQGSRENLPGVVCSNDTFLSFPFNPPRAKKIFVFPCQKI